MIYPMASLRGLSHRDLHERVREYDDAVTAEPWQSDLYVLRGICLLRLGVYDDALTSFKFAIRSDPHNSEAYFLASLATLGGRKAFMSPLKAIRAAETFLWAAVELDGRGVYYYMLAYIGYDYYERKYLNSDVHWLENLRIAHREGVSVLDIHVLFEFLGVGNPLPAI